MVSKHDFRSALSAYHRALEEFQAAAAAIETEGQTTQRVGRGYLAHLDQSALDAGTRATCLVRAVVDAKLLLLDRESGVNVDPHAVKHTIASLDARVTVLEVAVQNLQLARENLERHLTEIAGSGRKVLEQLRAIKADC